MCGLGAVKHPLIVIDVQDYFLEGFHGKDALITNVVKAIEQAKSHNQLVTLVEYDIGEMWASFNGYSVEQAMKTTARVWDAIRGYPNTELVVKYTDDGSREVRHALLNHGLPKIVNVCGINRDVCVLSTCWGLQAKGIEPRVIREASCNAEEYAPFDTIRGHDWTQANGVQVRGLRYA